MTDLLRSDAAAALASALGILGVFMVLVAYFLLQKESLRSDAPAYLWLNLIGSVLILVSVLYAWNLPAFVIECAWILISLYGLLKRWRPRAL